MNQSSTNRLLALLAAVLATAALLAGDAAPRARRQEVDAVTLGAWIRERRADLRLVDLRARADFELYHIPSAQQLAASGAQSDSGQVVVLYGDEQTDPPQFDAARFAGATNVLILRGGVRAWLDDIMNPQLPAQASPSQQQEYERKRELAEYFGGQATRFADPAGRATTTDQVIKQLKRRTC